MKPALVEDYGNPVYRSLARSVLSNFLLENRQLPFVVGMDSSIVHFKPWSQIVFNPRIKGGWKMILEGYYATDAYKRLNESVNGDPMLAKYATVHFLNALFRKAEEYLKKIKPKARSDNPVQDLATALDDPNLPPATKVGLTNSLVKALEGEAEEIVKDVEAMRSFESFSHLGLPVAQLLEKPDEFRKKARNRLVVHLVKFLQRLRREAPITRQARAPTLVGGRPLGVKRIQRWAELPRALPTEYLDDDLLEYRIASRTLRVTEQYGSLSNYVVYVDKSGSMANEIEYYVNPTQYEPVAKISFAAACAMALAWRLRQVGAKMTLKFFDTEVHDPITDFASLIDALLRITAISGTDISKVLEDAAEHHREERVLIITDGIDAINESSVRKAKTAGVDLTCIFIKTDNQLLRKNFPCIRIEEARPEVILNV